MKFLRKFNENLEDRLEIKDYCEMNLAYLIDEGFFIDVHSHGVRLSQNFLGAYYNITLRKSLTTNGNGVHTSYFKWDDIKDHYIPFIQRIKNTYKLSSDYINFTSSNSMDLISFPFYKLDDINVYWDLSRITFKIEEYSV